MGALGSHTQSALGSRASEAKAWEGASCLVIKWPESVHRGVAHSNLPAGQRAAHLSQSHHLATCLCHGNQRSVCHGARAGDAGHSRRKQD